MITLIHTADAASANSSMYNPTSAPASVQIDVTRALDTTQIVGSLEMPASSSVDNANENGDDTNANTNGDDSNDNGDDDNGKSNSIDDDDDDGGNGNG